MNIENAVRKPKLIEIKIEDPDIVETYGEAVTFWMNDFIDIISYFDFYKSQADNDGEKLNAILRKLIRNSEGKLVLGDEDALPVDLTVAALMKINEVLGKSKTKQST